MGLTLGGAPHWPRGVATDLDNLTQPGEDDTEEEAAEPVPHEAAPES